MMTENINANKQDGQEFNKDLSLGELVDRYLEQRVRQILKQDRFPAEGQDAPNTLSDMLDHYIRVHARYWHLEDAMAQAESVEEFAPYRDQAEALAKDKRPWLMSLLDRYFVEVGSNRKGATHECR